MVVDHIIPVSLSFFFEVITQFVEDVVGHLLYHWTIGRYELALFDSDVDGNASYE